MSVPDCHHLNYVSVVETRCVSYAFLTLYGGGSLSRCKMRNSLTLPKSTRSLLRRSGSTLGPRGYVSEGGGGVVPLGWVGCRPTSFHESPVTDWVPRPGVTVSYVFSVLVPSPVIFPGVRSTLVPSVFRLGDSRVRPRALLESLPGGRDGALQASTLVVFYPVFFFFSSKPTDTRGWCVWEFGKKENFFGKN